MTEKFDLDTEIQIPDHINNLFDLSGKVALITGAGSRTGPSVPQSMLRARDCQGAFSRRGHRLGTIIDDSAGATAGESATIL